MIDIAVHGQLLVRMTIQTMGWVGKQIYGVNDLLSRAVMSGDAGARPVGGDIVLDSFNFSPVGHNMTVAAELPRRIIGEIIRTNFHRMSKHSMIGPLISMTIETADLDLVQPLLNGLTNAPGVKECA